MCGVTRYRGRGPVRVPVSCDAPRCHTIVSLLWMRARQLRQSYLGRVLLQLCLLGIDCFLPRARASAAAAACVRLCTLAPARVYTSSSRAPPLGAELRAPVSQCRRVRKRYSQKIFCTSFSRSVRARKIGASCLVPFAAARRLDRAACVKRGELCVKRVRRARRRGAPAAAWAEAGAGVRNQAGDQPVVASFARGVWRLHLAPLSSSFIVQGAFPARDKATVDDPRPHRSNETLTPDGGKRNRSRTSRRVGL